MATPFKTSDQLFWSEIREERSTKRSMQVCYALLMAEHHQAGPLFWRTINSAVMRRFKMKRSRELTHFQQCAREIYSKAALAAPPQKGEVAYEQSGPDNQEPAGAGA